MNITNTIVQEQLIHANLVMQLVMCVLVIQLHVPNVILISSYIKMNVYCNAQNNILEM